MLRATQDKQQAPGATLGAWKASSSRVQGPRATLAEQEQQAPGPNGPKRPWQGAVLSAAEEGKKPPLWGKKSLPPPSCRAREAIFVVREQQAVA